MAIRHEKAGSLTRLLRLCCRSHALHGGGAGKAALLRTKSPSLARELEESAHAECCKGMRHPWPGPVPSLSCLASILHICPRRGQSTRVSLWRVCRELQAFAGALPSGPTASWLGLMEAERPRRDRAVELARIERRRSSRREAREADAAPSACRRTRVAPGPRRAGVDAATLTRRPGSERAQRTASRVNKDRLCPEHVRAVHAGAMRGQPRVHRAGVVQCESCGSGGGLWRSMGTPLTTSAGRHRHRHSEKASRADDGASRIEPI